MSGSFRTEYHIDFTGSTTGTADSSSGSVQLIIWKDEEASRGGQRHDTRYEWRQDAAEHEISSHD